MQMTTQATKRGIPLSFLMESMEVLVENNLSPNQLRVLLAIHKSPDTTVNDLSTRMNEKYVNINFIVGELMKHNLIARTDRQGKTYLYGLTEKGKALIAENINLEPVH